MIKLIYPNKDIDKVYFQGYPFYTYTNDITILPSLLNNNYETLEIELFKKLLKRGMNFVDVGANIGIYSVIGSKIVGEEGQVFSFEPEPAIFELLKKNIETNNCQNVEAINKAVGDKKAVLKLYSFDWSMGTHSIIRTSNQFQEVESIKLDDYFKEKNKKIDVIKIDVEGFEPYVLEGMKNLLNYDPIVFLEFNPSEITNSGYGLNTFQNFMSNFFKHLFTVDEKKKKIIETSSADLQKYTYTNIIASNSELNIAR